MTSPAVPVRTRFAPAPSGSLHVGNARTALFAWLFARGHRGSLVLRIEDTDASRATSEHMHSLMDILCWLGIDWDEGPDVGGPYAPYRQSERFDMYRDAASRLTDDGKAYACYCSPEELEVRRKEALAAGRTPGYDGRCRALTARARADFEAEGRRPALRFAVPPGETTFDDIVRGPVRFDHNEIADFVIMRADGSPVYLLAASVDDQAMEMSHIVRGEDLLSATPRQLLMYEALGATRAPRFAHLPLIVGADRQPLSKRHGDVALETYRERGFLPEAVMNYLALVGWSLGDGTTERFTRQELIEHFSLEGVSRNPAAFDAVKLTALNGDCIRGMRVDELALRIRPYLERAGVRLDAALLERIVPLIQERVQRLDEVASMVAFFFGDVEVDSAAAAKYLVPEYAVALERYVGALEPLGSWDAEAIKPAMYAVQEDLGLKKKVAFMPVRVAVTGTLVSPPLFESMEILGRETSLARLRAGAQRARSG